MKKKTMDYSTGSMGITDLLWPLFLRKFYNSQSEHIKQEFS